MAPHIERHIEAHRERCCDVGPGTCCAGAICHLLERAAGRLLIFRRGGCSGFSACGHHAVLQRHGKAGSLANALRREQAQRDHEKQKNAAMRWPGSTTQSSAPSAGWRPPNWQGQTAIHWHACRVTITAPFYTRAPVRERNNQMTIHRAFTRFNADRLHRSQPRARKIENL